MILAAGLGTRLGDLTRDTPKALIDVAGRPALHRVADALVRAGADRIVINVHHHADRIIEYVESQRGFGIDVLFSEESAAPLETGGGLVHAAHLFREGDPIILHNVDVLCDVDLRMLCAAHEGAGALATLAVSDRTTSRRLLFDDAGLCGRWDERNDAVTVRSTSGRVRALAFAGIHVIGPAFIERIEERGAFSIMRPYLRLAAEGERIEPFDIGAASWHEIGSPARLEAARAHYAEHGTGAGGAG